MIKTKADIAEVKKKLAEVNEAAAKGGESTAKGKRERAAGDPAAAPAGSPVRGRADAGDARAEAHRRPDQACIRAGWRSVREWKRSTKLLTRDYETAQKFYNDLLAKKSTSEMATDMERRQQGEQMHLLNAGEPARVSELSESAAVRGGRPGSGAGDWHGPGALAGVARQVDPQRSAMCWPACRCRCWYRCRG